ncbi:aldehyde dehydrogenase family protein [Brenneria tiliae]|uniref:Aldehyde dehydrogenase family protein n=1 Tax=Brenneria tiliae TaxID=2914984 RepID=A0ABT0MNE1_9GAMM|nr:aldehyde dehydrogenase family protein [Brenneria tiliae]MCL2891365.1 aldehyde dehydrogenase family protein [Brenneria tiliae]
MNWCVRILPEITGKYSHEDINIQAGFGPTGLPHIGTLCEILRTNLVKDTLLDNGYKVNFYLISDDLDPFRKIPLNIPNGDALKPFMGMPICKVPDPFGEYTSFSEMAESRLMYLVNEYNIDCQLIRSSNAYFSGFYNDAIITFLRRYDDINDLCAISTGPLRQRTYSIIMPFSEQTGHILEHIKIINVDAVRGEITYCIPSEEVVNKPGFEYAVSLSELYKNEILDQEITVSALNGRCKLQWKADWAMRQFSRSISFEMHGEDLCVSAKVAREIAGVLHYPAPHFYPYGLFLDKSGKKISKSKGNGFSLDDARSLLSDAAIRKFLSTDPARSRRFYKAMSPHLNDATCSKSAETFSHQKLVNIITAFHPVNEDSAMTFLKEKFQCYKLGSDEKLRRCIHFYLSQSENRTSGLNSAEIFSFSQIAKCLKDSSCVSGGERELIILTELGRCFPTLNRREKYQMLYRGLFGFLHGPRLNTWLNIHSLDDIISKLSFPFLLTDYTEFNASELLSTGKNENQSKGLLVMKNHMLYNDITLTKVQHACSLLMCSLQEKQEQIIKSLSGYQCRNVTVDEIKRSCEFLQNIHINGGYFHKTIKGVTSFLPLNQPLYASVCFGFIPSLMAEDVCIRPPTAMHYHYQQLMDVLDLTKFSSSLKISYSEKDIFLSERVNVTDAVIFTGTPENALKVRKHFRRDILFILNGAGHNPLVISDDAGIKLAVESALRVVLYNQGQDCAGPNSILVHQNVCDEFTSVLIAELEAKKHQVGNYSRREVIVGPNSDPEHTVKLAPFFRFYREYCVYGGEINPTNSMIYPTVFVCPLMHGGNYKEFFAPVFFIQPYDHDDELERYFSHPQYQNNAMYISLFGSSRYIEKNISKKLHMPESILHNTDLHLEEKGYLPYGGKGPAASCLWINGERINGSTLPQRDIFNHLVRPAMESE